MPRKKPCPQFIPRDMPTIPVTGKQVAAAIDSLIDERDRYRGALESILWQTEGCNGILLKAVQSTAREALNP